MNKIESAYIDLLKKTLTDFHRLELGEYKPVQANAPTMKSKMAISLDRMLRKRGFALCRYMRSSAEQRMVGRDWPTYADTMVGLKRLTNVEECVIDVVKNNVPGDFIETGVWRGGTTIFMKAVLNVLNVKDRIVWCADSFEGLPKPDEDKYEQDKGDKHFEKGELKISLEQVKHNFEKYGLLDDQVKFLKGWFKDTLPTAPIQQLAILRLDGDMYESTMDGFVNLYHKLSPGGYLIVDDWGAVEACKQAVLDFRKQHNITDEIKQIDWASVYWKKSK